MNSVLSYSGIPAIYGGEDVKLVLKSIRNPNASHKESARLVSPIRSESEPTPVRHHLEPTEQAVALLGYTISNPVRAVTIGAACGVWFHVFNLHDTAFHVNNKIAHRRDAAHDGEQRMLPPRAPGLPSGP